MIATVPGANFRHRLEHAHPARQQNGATGEIAMLRELCPS